MSEKFSLNEDDLRNILDGMVDGVITINDKGEIISFNKSAETIFGYSLKEVIGQNVNILMPEPDSSQHDEYLKHHVTTGVAHIIGIGRDVIAKRKNGEHFPMRLSVVESSSKIQGERWFIGSCLDITLYKEQEEQLRRTLKMDALGKLIGGVAHDYNNMLGVILGYAEIIEDSYKNDPELQNYISEIRHAGERGRDLTNSLLSYSRKRSITKEVVLINDVLNNNERMISKILTAQIELEMQMDDELWPVYIDKGCLEDVMLNMGINAMHAMPEGGELKFRTSNIQLNSVDAQVLNIKPDDYIKLSISDTGIGMTKDVVSHIFEPFFTTKDEKGTGLGLSQVYSFVEKEKGTIRVYSEPGKGTAFSIFLPRYQTQSNDTDENEQPELTESKEYNGSGKILVVDDELAIRELSQMILTSHGYEVFIAEDGKQALSIIEKENIDLVLTDVIMPDMDGYELAHIIHYKYPDIRIQLCSGFADAHGLTVTNESLFNNMLHKPFSSKELLQHVKELLKN